jgi:hypothetical protein
MSLQDVRACKAKDSHATSPSFNMSPHGVIPEKPEAITGTRAWGVMKPGAVDVIWDDADQAMPR